MDFNRDIKLNYTGGLYFAAKENPALSNKEKSENSKQKEEFAKLSHEPRYWQNITFKGKIENPVYKKFDEILQNPACSASLCKKRTKCEDEIFEKVVKMVESGDITPEAFGNFLDNGINTWKNENWQYFPHMVETLEKDAKTEEKIGCKLFNGLCGEDLIYINCASLKGLKEVIENPSSVKLNLLEWGREFGRNHDVSYIFSNISNYQTIANLISEDNFEDYKNFVQEKINEGENLQSALWRAKDYENPATGKFDKKMLELAKYLQDKYSSEGVYYIKTDANKFLAKMINPKTGEFDKRAIEFVEKYYFEPKYFGNKNGYKKGANLEFQMLCSVLGNSCFAEGLDEDILDVIKDESGNTNKTNLKCILQFAKYIVKCKMGGYNIDYKTFNAIKDKNGVFEKSKMKSILKAGLEHQPMEGTIQYIETVGKYGVRETKKYTDDLNEIFKDEKTPPYVMLRQFIDNCYDENGNINQKNYEYFKNISPAIKPDYYGDMLFEFPKTKEIEDIFLKITDNGKNKLNNTDVEAFLSVVNKAKDENGRLDLFTKQLLIDNVEPKKNFLSVLSEIFNYCLDENGEGSIEENFDKTLFKQMKEIYAHMPQGLSTISVEDCAKILKDKAAIRTMPFKTKIALYEAFVELSQNINFAHEPEFKCLEPIIIELEAAFTKENKSMSVEDKNIQIFKAEILNSALKEGEEYTEFEQTMKDSIDELKQMQDGLPLKFSRKEFLDELSKVCDTDEKLDILHQKTGMEPLLEGGKIIGYNGIILLDNFDPTDEFQKSLYDICYKFFYENEVQTGDKKLDEKMNVIIKAVPEFINAIGKQQHSTHKYTLDIHQLLTLANSIDNPDYKKLNPTDKAIFKTACILHDISKAEGVQDRGHQELAALYAKGITSKIYKNEELHDRVYELIKNHHWLEEYSEGASEDVVRKIAFKFRRPNDFDIAKIMAQSDLMSVSDEFYEHFADKLSKNKLAPIEEKLLTFYSTGNAVFTDYPTLKEEKEELKQTYNGKTYQVINFHDIEDNEDLSKYGFEYNKTKENVNFLVHMISGDDMKKSLETLRFLSSSSNEGVLSESIITPKYKRTYASRKYGVLLSQINSNTINVCKENMGSGYEKNENNAISQIFCRNVGERTNFKTNLLKNLNINEEEITNQEYADFYKEAIASKNSLTQFPDSKKYKIGKYSVTGAEIKRAIIDFQTNLIDKKENRHNEIIGYAPKIKGVIAKEKSLKDVPSELLDFAYENNLPVILV